MRWSRREFTGRLTKFGALGLAARMLPRGMAAAQAAGAHRNARKIGYCVIGLGRIADHFIAGVGRGSTSKITGLVSGHRDKAERMAAQLGVPKSSVYSYEEMDRVGDNQAIDAVYVALPNSMHAEYTIRSAKAGKHVLCEKPMATTVADAEAMIAACGRAKVKLMIAYRLHYEPLHLKAVKLIRDGALGEVRAIDGAFGFNSGPGEWRLTKRYAGGGPLLDVGIYVLNASRYLTGEEPAEFKAFASTITHDGRFNEVEENASWTLKFPSGIVATGSTTYGAEMPGYYKVFGTRGWLEMGPAYGYEGLRLRASYRGGEGKATELDEANTERDPMQFTRQADHFTECILGDLTPRTPGEEGLRDMRSMRAIYRAAGLNLL